MLVFVPKEYAKIKNGKTKRTTFSAFKNFFLLVVNRTYKEIDTIKINKFL